MWVLGYNNSFTWGCYINQFVPCVAQRSLTQLKYEAPRAVDDDFARPEVGLDFFTGLGVLKRFDANSLATTILGRADASV